MCNRKNHKFIHRLKELTDAEIYFSNEELSQNPFLTSNKGDKYSLKGIFTEKFTKLEGSLKWTQIGSDIKGDSAGDYFGSNISISKDGNVLAVGAPGNTNPAHVGKVKIFRNNNGTWQQIGSDIDEGGLGGEIGGRSSGQHSISLSDDGSIVAIANYYSNANGINSGTVNVYKNQNNSWVKVGQSINGERAYDESGRSISLSGDGNVLAIGSSKNSSDPNRVQTINGPHYNHGHVRIFKNNSGRWEQIGSDIDTKYKDVNETVGYSVALSKDGNHVVIGAPKFGSDFDAGSPQMFEFIKIIVGHGNKLVMI